MHKPIIQGSVAWQDLIDQGYVVISREDYDALTKWRPIETAPKDGTHILAGYWYDYSPKRDRTDIDWVCDTVFLIETDGLIDGNRDFNIHMTKDGELALAAFLYSHWMPLPEPPK